MRYTQYKSRNQYVLFNQNVLSAFCDSIFETTASHVAHICSDAQGRGTVEFFEHEGRELVLKRYHRGGLVGRFVSKTYLFSGLKKARMWQEFELLAQMRDLGLPVPRPIAARCIKTSPLTYQGDVIVERICNARTLAELLCQEALPEKTWEAIGLVIRRFHQHHVDHADLNACNILLNAPGQIYLIDFDKSHIRAAHDHGWCQSNLSRLRRSLQKWKKQQPAFHFESRHWQALERGYQGAQSLPAHASRTAQAVSR
ncbi:3-deoxy-D-manno-octulosonic acid kinase [Pseudohongiella sp.]|uniref:3-deoxy-D-manno-octulosonic acid kinase n=1 Tax=marine sediment metagenome TaxID=412755 RepID=A0A0F9VYC5_9ZZZZ|nr:3-deoxy-D-manno-octulosonic acid kinase [Pseudohongiella sp.]HDZ07917.1 3-deoxy-D-manno-octulosonic acid kinase [Pseudohongiella sp.]HEA64476.1 3-deoxy-D-manno-octulosonic acid kinase [Pseudohongiella sp.]